MIIRSVSLENDTQMICNIYNHYIENTVITFETQLLTMDEMYQRVLILIEDLEPFFVAEVDQKIVGYTYIDRWNTRSAYSATKEMSIYLDNKHTDQNIGSLLYQQLFNKIKSRENIHVLIAGITLPNEPSIRLHEKCGFEQVSYMKEVGYKFEKWLDLCYWQLILN